MTKKEEKKELIAKLSKIPVTNIKFDWKSISLKYGKVKIIYKVKIHPHEWGIADWSRKKKLVWVDDDVRAKDIIILLIHESIEKYVAQKYKLNVEQEAHKIAQAVERKYFRSKKRKKMSWQNYHKRINKVWKKEHRYRFRNKRSR